MATQFPIVIEREASGAFSAYIPGLPVYAQGPSKIAVVRAIRHTLAAYLEAHPHTKAVAEVKVATVMASAGAPGRRVAVRGPAAWVGGRTSPRKAAASRANGKLGGRPRKHKHPAEKKTASR